MKIPSFNQLSRRERQIMDIIHQEGEADVSRVLEKIPNPPKYNSIRKTLAILEEKGHLMHHKDGPRYVYTATQRPEQAKKGALDYLMTIFFEGSAPKVVSSLLQAKELSEEELDQLSEMIEKAKKDRKHE